MKQLVILTVTLLLAGGNFCQAGEYAINEQFSTLDAWVPVTFPKIEKHSEYEVVEVDGKSVLRTRSNDSASGIRCTKEFDVYAYPFFRWRWKVENVYEQGDVETKSGDDYPLRVYVMFKYDTDKASFKEKVKYGLAKMVYGEYPPQSSLNYIWANRSHGKRIYPSTYTDRSRLVIVRSGSVDTGRWIEEQVNILDDYQQAFGQQPPRFATIAIMNDSDNTGESAVSYMDFIQVLRNK